MALIKCGECGKEVSDKAVSCLGCGAPIAEASAREETLATRLEGAPDNESKKSGWTVFWLVLVGIAFIGQTASIYIPAFVGISPADGDPNQAMSRIIGALLWPILLGVLTHKLKGRRKVLGALYGLISGLLLYIGGFFVAAQYSS